MIPVTLVGALKVVGEAWSAIPGTVRLVIVLAAVGLVYGCVEHRKGLVEGQTEITSQMDAAARKAADDAQEGSDDVRSCYYHRGRWDRAHARCLRP